MHLKHVIITHFIQEKNFHLFTIEFFTTPIVRHWREKHVFLCHLFAVHLIQFIVISSDYLLKYSEDSKGVREGRDVDFSGVETKNWRKKIWLVSKTRSRIRHISTPSSLCVLFFEVKWIKCQLGIRMSFLLLKLGQSHEFSFKILIDSVKWTMKMVKENEKWFLSKFISLFLYMNMILHSKSWLIYINGFYGLSFLKMNFPFIENDFVCLRHYWRCLSLAINMINDLSSHTYSILLWQI